MRDLEKNKEKNEFLKQVFEDYNKYKDHIINQKKDQKICLRSNQHLLNRRCWFVSI